MSGSDIFSPSPGTYLLVIDMVVGRRIRVGALGRRSFAPGTYLYVGSALGPGGLRARLAHHECRTDRPHWHLDYLRRHASVTEVWTATGRDRLECEWVRRLLGVGGVHAAVPGFGASDCRCPAHLLTAVRTGGRLISAIGERLQPAVAYPVCWP